VARYEHFMLGLVMMFIGAFVVGFCVGCAYMEKFWDRDKE
jgi:hypothetical protein